MTEILAPAGDEQSAYAALSSGADAVYLGLTRFSARQSAENFDIAALERVTEYAHLLGAKVYVCLNTLVKDGETDEFFENARLSRNAGADGIIMQDVFLGKALKKLYPEIVLHLSTQAGCCNVYGAQLAAECGFSRVVLARETPLKEIGSIAKIIETEAFVQGALCTAFSGQCYFSSFAGNNSGNRGRCKQPCRKTYSIDRKGFETPAYALSPSDLCVGKRVKEFLDAGVSSLKIEGRMRRPEYVAAAVRYYRALLEQKEGEEEFSRLKRAYNRGDYTQGLAFGQRDFLSRKVQGHIGEEVGKISLVGGKYFCAGTFTPSKGDAFKILREGTEVGGAVFLSSARGGFYLTSSRKLRAGDAVRITTDIGAGKRTLSSPSERRVNISLSFRAGERMRAEGEGVVLEGDVLECAKTAPMSQTELLECFRKTDGLPLAPEIAAVTEGAFCPKSVLNAFRREFYTRLAAALAPAPEPLEKRTPPVCTIHAERGTVSAVIGAGEGEIRIFKPDDYRAFNPPKGAYLYLPPFFTAEDEVAVAPSLPSFAGVYCDGYYGVKFAERYGVKLFAGCGFNLTNRYAVSEVMRRAEYFTLSKELSRREQDALAAKGAFSLVGGGIKVMDLCYCPFEMTCADCDARRRYLLTDEEGRRFPLIRYRAAEKPCRFEIYNCAPLSSERGLASVLRDGSVSYPSSAGYTKGHSERSMQ